MKKTMCRTQTGQIVSTEVESTDFIIKEMESSFFCIRGGSFTCLKVVGTLLPTGVRAELAELTHYQWVYVQYHTSFCFLHFLPPSAVTAQHSLVHTTTGGSIGCNCCTI